MFDIDKIKISLAFSPYFFILSLVIVIAYSIYIYRYTVPQVSTPFKLLLVSLRSLALLLILFIIFEPVLNITKRDNITPINLIFVDDSRSIKISDGTKREETVKDFLSKVQNSSIIKKSEFYSFGNKVKKVSADSLKYLSFNEPSTNFSNIFRRDDIKERNISSIVFVSDGVITDGANPVYSAEKFGIPVYTLGVGDTTRKNNLEIRKALYNEYIYAGTPTVVNMVVLNTGYKENNIPAILYEDGVQVDKKEISFQSDGTANVSFNYTPKSPGEKKLTLSIGNLKNEITYADNKKVVYINVFNNKLNTLILAGSPSPDLSFVKNSLSLDENLKISTLTQTSGNKFLEKADPAKVVDSADVFYFVGFPSSQTPPSLFNKVLNIIKTKNKPLFFVLSSSTDLNKLKLLEDELPFNIQRISYGFTEVQPYIPAEGLQSTLIENNDKNSSAWNNMPPVYRSNSEFTAKPESEVISRIKINNIPVNSPLILSRKVGTRRSAAILAKDIWKWKLQTAEKNIDVFDRLLINSAKWLNTKENQSPVTIKTSKKSYSLGEPVEFSAQVYDETFNPVEDAEVVVDVKTGNEKYQVIMSSLGSGLYEGSLSTTASGDYQFSGSAKINNKVLGKDNGKFSIGDVDIEQINPRMDKEFLTLLSTQTKGKFFDGSNSDKLIKALEENSSRKVHERVIKSEFTLWSNKWLMISVIVLFALEWFFRKRSGML